MELKMTFAHQRKPRWTEWPIIGEQDQCDRKPALHLLPFSLPHPLEISQDQVEEGGQRSVLCHYPVEAARDGLKKLLKKALTDQIDTRETFMKGMDHSYYCE
jgi:hypothetical protein